MIGKELFGEDVGVEIVRDSSNTDDGTAVKASISKPMRGVVYAWEGEVDKLRTALMRARDKLRHYRDAHGGEYVGGVEYSNLMREIDEALK